MSGALILGCALHSSPAGFSAWRSLARQRQLLWRQACIIGIKRQALQLSSCLTAWHDAARAKQRLAAACEAAVVQRRARQLAGVLGAWRQCASQRQQLGAQEQYAAYFQQFMSLLKGVQRLKAHVQRRRLKQLKLASADARRRSMLLRCALARWGCYARDSLARRRRLAAVLSLARCARSRG